MKAIILALSLLTAAPALAQKLYRGPEVGSPVKMSSAIILHSSDSAATAYTKTLRALLAAGYGIERSDKDGLYITTSTPGKGITSSIFLTIRVAITPVTGGSEVAFRGVYTWASAVMMMAEKQNQPLPVFYVAGRSANPYQRAWDAMHEVALAAIPGARVGYK